MAKYVSYLFQKRERFSIRRLSVGVASVTIGCLFFGNQVALANDSVTDDSTSSVTLMESMDDEKEEESNTVMDTPKVDTDKDAPSEILAPAAPTRPSQPAASTDRASEANQPDYEKNEHQIGGIKDVTVNTDNTNIFDITYTNGYKGQLSVYNDHVVRYQVIPEKEEFQEKPEPSSPDRPADIVTKKITDYSAMKYAPVLASDEQDFHIVTSKIRIDLRRKDSLMSVTDIVADKVILQEAAPLELTGHTSKQTLRSHETSQYFGGGTQNGRFSHKGESIRIVNENNWVDKGVASPNPFYWSSDGYGVLRHTFKPGNYDFEEKNPKLVTTTHQDGHFDAYYFINPSFTGILKDYYDLTGKPVVLPIFALYEGHLNAYNRDIWVDVPERTSGAVYFEELGKWYKEYQPSELGNRQGIKETLNGKPGDANYAFTATAVVDRYKKNDMPLGWMLVNDGYGAGYGQADTLAGNVENLKKFAEDAKKKGVLTGLWTQSDLHPKAGIPALLQRDLNAEVRDGLVRVLKTDVAWVGSGYSFGLNGITDAAKIMKDEGKDARPFIITLDGWAGTQRYGGIWTGDQTGGQWEYIRFHIPTYIGTGLSGNPNVGSDMDGIFGGKNKVVNTRDYQWKTFTPLQLNMDGWGWNPKNPYAMDQTTTDINRTYLKMKSMLVPYSYSLAHEAVDGAPIVQAMFLQFPKESINYSKDVQYQFMYGKNFLIAPVYENVQGDVDGNDVRNRIYLPSGAKWIDYFTGKSYEGGQMLNNYDAPIWKLPIFVRSGAIIPVTNPHNNYTEINHKLRQVDFYPDGQTDFDLIEDDGLTNSYLNGKIAKTHITSDVRDGVATLTINQTDSHFEEFQAEKASQFNVNVSKKPSKVQLLVDGQEISLTTVDTLEAFQNGHNVYYYDQSPNLNQFSTAGSKLATVDMTKNPVVRVKSDLLDVTKHTVQVKVTGYELNLPAQENYTQGEAAAPELTINDKENTPTAVNITWQAVNGAQAYELEMDGVRYTNLKETSFQHRDLGYGSSHHYRLRALVGNQYTQWSPVTEGHTKENPLANAIDHIRISSNRNAQSDTPHKYLVDKDLSTMYHSKWSENSVPEELTLDLNQAYSLDKLEYIPRENGGNGTITAATISTSLDGVHWTPAQNVSWKADNSTKTLQFAKGTKARYISVLATKAVGSSFVSGLEMLVYKQEGTDGQVLGDVTGDGKVDTNDLTSLKNYAGLRQGIDSDFQGYVQVADLNENDVIDAFDIYYVTRGLGTGTKPANEQATGQLKWTASKTQLVQGEEVTLTLTGKNLKAVEAIYAHLPIDKELYEVLGTVSLDPALEQMRNFSTIRTHGNQEREAFVILANDKTAPGVEGNLTIASLKLRAKKAHTLKLPVTENYVLGTNLITSLENKTETDPSTETQPETTVTEIPSNRITVTGKDVYQAGQGLDKLIDGNPDTLAELKWDWAPNYVNGKLPKEISLPQDIVFQFDPDTPTYLHSMDIVKRTPGNGTVTKFQVRTYNGSQLVSDTGEVISPFTEATSKLTFERPVYVDKVVLTVLEARTGADTVNNQMMTLRDVHFYESSDALQTSQVPNSDLTVTGEDVYQAGQGLDKLNDGNLDTLAELKWDWEPNHVNGKLPKEISLPQDITFSMKDKEVHYLTGLEIFKRTPGNGTVTKYNITAYQGDQVTYQSPDIETAFKEAGSTHNFGDLIPADKVVLTILEARTGADRVNNQMMTLREVKLYEIAKELIPHLEDPTDTPQPEAPKEETPKPGADPATPDQPTPPAPDTRPDPNHPVERPGETTPPSEANKPADKPSEGTVDQPGSDSPSPGQPSQPTEDPASSETKPGKDEEPASPGTIPSTPQPEAPKEETPKPGADPATPAQPTPPAPDTRPDPNHPVERPGEFTPPSEPNKPSEGTVDQPGSDSPSPGQPSQSTEDPATSETKPGKDEEPSTPGTIPSTPHPEAPKEETPKPGVDPIQPTPPTPDPTPAPNHPVEKPDESTPSQPETKPSPTDQPNVDTPSHPSETPPSPQTDLRLLTDPRTGLTVVARDRDLNGATHLEVHKVASQVLQGRTYDAYDVKLKDAQNRDVQPRGMVLVRLEVAGQPVEQVYYVTPDKQLQALSFEQKGRVIEFMTNHFSVYAVVYRASGEILSTQAESEATSPTSAPSLPNTGDQDNSALSLVAGLTLALLGLGLMKKKDS